MSLFLNSDDFLAGLNGSVDKAKEAFASKVRNVVTDVHRGVTEKTPVNTGQTLANMQWTMNEPTDTVLPAAGDGPVGATNSMPLGVEPRRLANQAVADASLEKLTFDPPWNRYIIQNNTAQAEGLENGLLPKVPLDQRSPHGMFKVTLSEVQQRLADGRYDP